MRHRDSHDGEGLNYHGSVLVGHLGAPRRDVFAECYDDIAWYTSDGSTSLLWDRFHWGCPIYGPVYRPKADIDGYGELGLGGFRVLELALAAKGAGVVLVDQPAAVIKARFEAIGHDSYAGDVTHALGLRGRYYDFITGARPLTYLAKSEVASLDDPAERAAALNIEADRLIAAAAVRAEYVASALGSLRSYIGAPQPDVLLAASVMQRQTTWGANKPGIPMLGALLGMLGSGAWQRVGVVNTVDDRWEDMDKAAPTVPVIALDRAAAYSAGAAGRYVAAVPDPRLLADGLDPSGYSAQLNAVMAELLPPRTKPAAMITIPEDIG